MKNLYFTEDNYNYNQCFIRMLQIYGIKINKDYQFVYDELLINLINDTTKWTEKYFDPNYIRKDGSLINKTTYTFNVFHIIFLTRCSTENYLSHPENCPEFKRKVRINKLNKIHENKD